MKTIFNLNDVALGSILLLLVSCNSEPSRIGGDFFKDGLLDISVIDSSTVKLSTVRFDSLITNGGSRIILGTYDDEKLGRLSASGYFQPSLAGVDALGEANIVFDHLSVILKYDTYSYADTTVSLTLKAYQLKESIQLFDAQFLYNTTRLSAHITPLGSVSFMPRPNSGDSLELKLDKTFGDAFFLKAKKGDSEFTSDSKFASYIRGFLLAPDSSVSASVVGFTSNVELRLYYLDKNEIPTRLKYISFKAANTYSATHIHTNRSQTKLQLLPSYKSKLSASVTDNQSYLQAGAGLALRVDIPYLRDLNQLSNFYMTRAVLELQPVRKSYADFTPLPEKLKIHFVNYRNVSYGEYSSDASIREDLALGRDTYYEVDATAFVKAQMENEALNENALLFFLSDEDFRFGAERIYFSGPSYTYNTRLKIFFATITN
jgi:hypothetical protein